MQNQQGDFIWYELMTSDADAASAFYADVVGWQVTPAGMPDMDYRFLWAGAADDQRNGAGGLLGLTQEMIASGARPAWMGYLAVDTVDDAVARISAAGGSVLMPAWDIPDVGRMAMVTDPQGAPFYVMRGFVDDVSHAFAKYAPKLGHCAWNELASSDPASAWLFYGALFGWQKDGDLDMGPMGKYEFVKSDTVIGAIMPKMPDMPSSMWSFYFRVADIDAAAARIKAGGGTILQEPMEIPGGDFSLNAVDPQGAPFGLVGARA